MNQETLTKTRLDDTFNAAAYIETFNPVHTADGYKLEVIDFTGNLRCFYPIRANFIPTWDGENHCYGEDYHNILFRYFKDIKDSLDRIPEAKRNTVLSHLYVVFKADSVFRYVSGAVQCHKATLYGMNPEGKGLIELGHSCYGNCKKEDE